MKTPQQKKAASPRLLTNGPSCEPTHDEIALRAYSLWEQQGRPQNQEVAIWLRAEAQLRQSQHEHGVQA
jgi:hypothetical protein